MPKVTSKKKCCKDKSRCAKCPLLLMRLVQAGYAEKDGKSDYQVSKKVPKKVLVAARAR
ncbi:MAG: hypothetical protein QOE58_3605 [Actinomycetota bacterium]|nr:hypothetical protein [Actinomycetota bacterium]